MSVVLQWLSCVPDAGGAAKPENNSVSFGLCNLCPRLAFTTRLETLQAVDLQRYNAAGQNDSVRGLIRIA